MPNKLEANGVWIARWEVESRSEPDKKRVVAMKVDGTWGCSCGGWIFNKQRPRADCWHIEQVKLMEPVDKTRTTPSQEHAFQSATRRRPGAPAVAPPPQPYFVLQTRRLIHLD
jgi:hypothetical protein